jgi:hypothetical protein
MLAQLKIPAALIALISISHVSTTDTASAITAELARKCQALTAKAFPPRVIGNPAAGSAKGTGRDESAYYKKCVENDGKMNEQKQAK